MGLLVEGTWKDEWYEADEDGRFVRPQTRFRSWVRADGSTPFAPEVGRYHLYVSLACPWAHRTLIMRALRGLEQAITVTVVDPKMGDNGWEIPGEGDGVDPIHGARFLHEVYTAARADYTGRVTVPVLWDRKEGTIVSNESRDILRMLDVEFTPIATRPVRYWSSALHDRIEETMDAIYEPINNGVYRAGFATSQQAYEEAFSELFDALDHWDEVLGRQRYLCGDQLTEADWCLFTTLVRFDPVYVGHFKCNLRRIADYPHLSGYLRELYQVPGVAATVNLEHIRTHYYWSHPMINPTRIVPVGPALDLDAPHGRERVGGLRAS